MVCLEKIVGLSRKNCECFTDGRPSDYQTSLSGLYLDELTGLTQKNIDTSKECGEGEIWDIMQKALQNGELRFRTDLLSAINKKFKNRLPSFEGVIGKKEFNGTVPSTETFNGVRIESNCIKGSCFILKGIDAFFDQTHAAIEVNIFRSDCDDPLFTFDIETLANKKKVNTLPNPIELPLYVEGLSDFFYHIIYTLPGGTNPLNNTLNCKCNKNKKRPWALWVDVEGIKTDAFATVGVLDDLAGQQFTYGLNLVTQIECKKATIICEEGHVWDFVNDDISLQIAHAIQEAAGVILAEEILTRPDSAYFALNEEQLIQLATKYELSYRERIDYLSVNIDISNDCFVCNDQMQGVAILA